MKKKSVKKNSKSGVIFRRFRKTKDGKVLDAHDYGYKAWPIPIRPRKGK